MRTKKKKKRELHTYTCAINSVGTGSVCQDLELKMQCKSKLLPINKQQCLECGCIVLGTSFVPCEQ